MRLTIRTLLAILLLAVFILPVWAQRPPNDWTQWRGPNRDGSAPAPSDPKAWPEKLTQKWKVEVGSGYATPLVVGNRIYQFSRQGEREVMTALDADTGKSIWQTGCREMRPNLLTPATTISRTTHALCATISMR